MENFDINKYLIGETNGEIDQQAYNELILSKNAKKTQGEATLTSMRDSMGGDAVDISRNELYIEDRVIKGHVAVRTYKKKSLVNEELPLLLYLHGGSYFGGSIQNVEELSRAFADKGDFLVVSIGYRLAPEKPFPAGLLDTYNVAEYYYTNAEKEKIDKEQIFVAGDSAGGGLSFSVSLLDRAVFKTNYISKILAYYPSVEFAGEVNEEDELWDIEKIKVNTDKDRELLYEYIRDFWYNAIASEWYSAKLDSKSPLISPLYAEDDALKLLPPTYIICGELDPLRIQNDLFINQLKENGVDYQYSVYSGMIHAFLDKLGDYRQAEEGVIEGVKFLEGK